MGALSMTTSLSQTVDATVSNLLLAAALLIIQLLPKSGATRFEPAEGGAVAAVTGAGTAVTGVLQDTWYPSCSVMLLTDPTSSPAQILKEFADAGSPWGVVVLRASKPGQANDTTLTSPLPNLIRYARQVRLLYPCVSLVVLSDDLAFWTSFGDLSLAGRLLVWETRLVCATSLPLETVRVLAAAHWIYAMMNTVILVRETPLTHPPRCIIGIKPYYLAFLGYIMTGGVYIMTGGVYIMTGGVYIMTGGVYIMTGGVYHDRWCVYHDRWCVYYDRCVYHDRRYVYHDRWCVYHDRWCVYYDRRYECHDRWCVYHDRWCVYHDRWCVYIMTGGVCVYPDRWRVYSYAPYTQQGAQLVKVASLWPAGSIHLLPGHTLFQSKFSNFHRAKVNVTALPYKPYWDEVVVEADSGSSSGGTKKYSGSDRLMLEAIAQTLNFTIHVLPVQSWQEVVTLVEERVSFVASVVHLILQNRIERYSFTSTYEHSINLGFAMAKPSLRPQWQSLYYPLADGVWATILFLLLIMPPVFYLVSHRSSGGGEMRVGNTVLVVVGALFGQPMQRGLPTSTTWRGLLAAWLVFTFIVTTAYRGNLIAFLSLPKYPPRPETLQHLVTVVNRITMPSYGSEFLNFLRESESPTFRAWGELMTVGVSVTEGLHQALRKRQAHVDGRRYLELVIAESFTDADGETALYVGREGVLPGFNAWPIPHDAPYKDAFDRVINVVIESGLYNKWMADILAQTRREAQQKRKLEQASQTKVEAAAGSSKGVNQSLTLVHLQGPLLLLLLGLLAASLAFIVEVGLMRFWRRGT
ncbi:ionotropic receptor 21a-like [Cherax quadricarinatus]|uniref:ionotropic receptor 21a-like n=1 Tax=Cherax quadricarinatus TaxID=27406 RepID=UPI00387E5485